MTIPALVQKHATTLTTGLFLISAISGVALFFHVLPQTFSEMHEWLSMLLLLPVGLHLWRNWPAFLGYFRRRAIYLPMAASLALAVLFVVPTLSGGSGGPRGMGRLVAGFEQATIAETAPILDTSPEALAAHLVSRGYVVESADETLADIAARSGQAPREVLMTATTVPAR